MKFIKKWGSIIAAAAGVLAVVFYLFLDVVKVEGWGDNGLNCMLGKDGMDFSIMLLLTVALLVAGAVVSFLSSKKEGDLYKYVAAACFVVGAIFCFCTKNFWCSANGLGEVKSYYDLAIGGILAGILSIVGAAAVIAPKFIKD